MEVMSRPRGEISFLFSTFHSINADDYINFSIIRIIFQIQCIGVNYVIRDLNYINIDFILHGN
jgi:hypothetical protein